jgi:hypothetical protein
MRPPRRGWAVLAAILAGLVGAQAQLGGMGAFGRGGGLGGGLGGGMGGGAG